MITASKPRLILVPEPPSSRRTPSTEATFLFDLFGDLTTRLEWLEQVLSSVRDSEAIVHLRGWAGALRDLQRGIARVQSHLPDPRFARLFALDGPLTAFLSRLYAWCEEISADFEMLARKLRSGEPVLGVIPQREVNASFANFEALSGALRESLPHSRPMTPEAQAAWHSFDADFEELLWATEWLHMSLAAQPGT